MDGALDFDSTFRACRVYDQSLRDTGGPQPLRNPLENRCPKNVEAGEWNSGHHLFLRSAIRNRNPEQHERLYIHGCHLGAAARKIADREGTQDGIRRKREIGSRARARW